MRWDHIADAVALRLKSAESCISRSAGRLEGCKSGNVVDRTVHAKLSTPVFLAIASDYHGNVLHVMPIAPDNLYPQLG